MRREELSPRAHTRTGGHSVRKVATLRRLLWAGFAMSILLSGATIHFGAHRADDFARAFQEFKKNYEDEMRREGIGGSSFFFVKDNQVIARDFYGLADAEGNRPVDEETIYHWASITKTFTGIAIMQLRDRGLLSLDDPVIKYVPELRAAHNPYGDMSQVTIRHLMTHSAGFRAGTWPWGGDQPWHPFEPTRWTQLVAMMPYTELQFRPGTKYSY